jgi:glycerophosphoryl diester phosphodiesterase
MRDKVLASSFVQDSIDAFRRECPEVASSATRDEVLVFFVLHRFRLVDVLSPRYQSLQVPLRAAGWDLVTPDFIEAARRRGLAVQPWTINEEDDFRRLIALGVDGVSTDDPGRLRKLLN